MKLVLNGINGRYLRDLIPKHSKGTTEVIAAVAYAQSNELLFDWCTKNRVPLKFYGRLDENVAVSPNVLRNFLRKGSPNFVCKLVEHHHAKLIWWRGHGVYIGSANLTQSAWYKNVEAGCFFEQSEIDEGMEDNILSLIATLETHATPLTEELVNAMEARAKDLHAQEIKRSKILDRPSVSRWNGLGVHNRNKRPPKEDQFLREWHSTLQILRDIAARLTLPENRPMWLKPDVPSGALADQFLHAHYYGFIRGKAKYETEYTAHRGDPDRALSQAIEWWRQQECAPNREDEMLHEKAPKLRSILSEENLKNMTLSSFKDMCSNVHAITTRARQVGNKALGLPETSESYSIPVRTDILAEKIWKARNSTGRSIVNVLWYLLHEGPPEFLPERLWSVANKEEWKLPELGISSYGEIVGWAHPSMFPPRNGRTSKSLRSLGFDVVVHVD